MTKIDALRKIIREEVAKAIRQELPKIISEVTKKPTGIENVKREFKKQSFPTSLNTVETYRKPELPTYASSNILDNLLKETATSMMDQDVESMSYTQDDVNPTDFFQPKNASVGTIDSMISTARPSSDISHVQINTVPDYSNLMKSLKEKGAI
jgi:hypothetical protein